MSRTLHQATYGVALLLGHPKTGKLQLQPWSQLMYMSMFLSVSRMEVNLWQNIGTEHPIICKGSHSVFFEKKKKKVLDGRQPRFKPKILWQKGGSWCDQLNILSHFRSIDPCVVLPLWRLLWVSELLIGWSSPAKEEKRRKQLYHI